MKIKIKSVPTSKGEQFFNTMTQFPNLYHNVTSAGLTESDTTGTNDEQISDTLKPIERENANIEAEIGEVLVRPGLAGMYKIGGKTHEKGGTPLAADEGSFIFSNDRDLAFNKKELKSLGIDTNFKRGEATPAKVLLKKVKPKD